MTRIPNLGFDYDPYEIPLIYGPHVPLWRQWTMVLCMDKRTHALLGATIYNGDKQRGCYLHSKPDAWELTQFDHLMTGEENIPSFVMRAASFELNAMLGPTFQVSHNLLPNPEKCYA